MILEVVNIVSAAVSGVLTSSGLVLRRTRQHDFVTSGVQDIEESPQIGL
jgi:hypothetical protein